MIQSSFWFSRHFSLTIGVPGGVPGTPGYSASDPPTETPRCGTNPPTVRPHPRPLGLGPLNSKSSVLTVKFSEDAETGLKPQVRTSYHVGTPSLSRSLPPHPPSLGRSFICSFACACPSPPPESTREEAGSPVHGGAPSLVGPRLLDECVVHP